MSRLVFGNRTINYQNSRFAPKNSVAISISSGKGGVGKTVSTIFIAKLLSRLGQKVLIFDADLGLSNVEVVMGLQPRYNISHMMDQAIPMSQLIVRDSDQVSLISSGSGITDLQNLSGYQKSLICEQFMKLNEEFDYILFDSGAGIGDNVIQFSKASDMRVVVTTPEPHALSDAFALIKVLSQSGVKNIYTIVNQVKSEVEAQQTFQRLSQVSQKFLDIDLGYLGSVPFDMSVKKSILRNDIASPESQHSMVSQAYSRIVRNLMERMNELSIQKNSGFKLQTIYQS